MAGGMGRVAALLWLFFSSALGGCVEHCVVGETNACACTDGRAGRQVCGSFGTFEPCACTSIAPDAGAPDAGFCSTSYPLSIELNQPLRLAVGTGATVRASTSTSATALRHRWTLHGPPIDAGLVDSSPIASVQFDRPGTWWLEVDVSGQAYGECQAGHGRGGLLEVVPTTTLPLVVVDAACCDTEGHAYVVSDSPPTLWRFGRGGLSLPTPLPRRPKRLVLSDDGSVLFVGQDAYVSTYLVPSLAPQWELPISGVVGALTGTAQYLWLFTAADATRLDLATGTLTPQLAFNQWNSSVVTDAVLGWDGSLALDTGGYLLRVLVTGEALRQPTSTPLRSCGKLWSLRGRKELFAGCGTAFEPAPDGGLVYAGRFEDGTDPVRALGFGAGRAFVVSGQDQSRQPGRLRTVDLATFEALETREVSLWSSSEDTYLLPHWVLSQADAGTHVLSAAPNLGLTWVEHLP